MKFRALRYTLLLIALSSITLLLRASLPTVATGTWVAAGNLSAARSGACTVVLSDGRLLISGGADANGPTGTADLFSTTGSWLAAASMTAPRAHQSCAVLPNGHVLVAGGTTSGGGITKSAEIYDPSADSWAQAGIMNDARSGATASVLQDGRVLIAGGQSSGGAVNTLEIFDPASGNFSNAGTMSSPRQDHAAAVLSDGRVLIVGGSSEGANALATTDIYDPQAGSASAGPAMSTPRARHTATTLLDGTVVVIGGSDYTNDLASTEFFDPVANNFNAASSLATARSKHSAFLLPNNNEVLVVGGQSAGADPTSGVTDLASAELYIPWQKTFQATGAMATPRSDATGAALTKVNGRLLIAGGSTASAELYGFATVKTDAADYPPGTTVNITGTGWQPGETVTLTLVESPLIDTHGPYPVVADAFGNISDSSFTTDIHDLSIRFYLTAVGSVSQAQNTFTDAVKVNTSVASNNNPSVVGQSVTLTATATQQGNNIPVTCGSIQFQDGGSNLGSAVALNGSGQASLTSTTLTQGPHTITAVYSPAVACSSNSNNTDTSLTQLVAGTATKLAFVQQPTNTVAGQSVSPAVTVEVEDVNGTRVNNSTASITMAIGNNPGSGTLAGLTTVNAVNGTATFSNLSINKTGTGYTLSATSGVLSSATSSTFNITPGAATQLAFSQQPTNTAAGASITSSVTVQVLDASNNLVTTGTGSNASIAIAIGTNPSGGTLSGTTTVTAAAGVATFSNLSIDKVGSGYTLAASSTGLTGATSSTFNITPGAASKLVFIQQPTNTTAAQTITPAVTVQVQDASGNLVTTSTASITVAIGTNPGSGTLSGTLTQSAVGGVATFGNLSINKAGTGYTLTAGSTGLTGATSSTFNITAGTAAQLVFSQQPSNTQAGSSISPAVGVQVQDGSGNVVTTSTVSITVAIGSNPSGGTLSGTKTVSASAGLATFSNLSIDKAGNSYTLSAGSTGLTGVTSSPFNVLAGAATKLVVTGSATQTAGTGNNLTITAEDNFGNTDTTFGNGTSGNVSLTFSGANSSPDPATQPTATNKNGAAVTFGTGTALMFVNGASSSVMTLYKAETANISVADGQGVTPGSLTVVVSTAAANKLALSGSTANLSSGSTRVVIATVQDAFGNTIASDTRSVTFTQTAGTGSVTGLGSSNAVAGVATQTVTGNLAGTVTITASAGLGSGTGNPITFNVVAGAAAKLALSGATTDLASGSTRTLTATIQDAVGNTVNTGADSTISITFARTSGTGTVTGLGSSNAVAGVATVTVTGALAGPITIMASGTASTGALAASTGNPITFNVVAGPAAKLALSGSTADLASGNTRQLTATIQDAGGNTVSTGADSTISISFARTAGTGTVTGLGSSSAVAGVATITVTGNLAGPVTITASGTASTGALAMGAGNPIAVNVVAGAAAKLAFAQQPANTTAGQTIPAVTVQILDANGNLTGSTASVAMALTGSPAGVTLSGTLTKAAVSGVATFNDLSINKGGTYTLSATSSGLTGATSASFTINNPAPTLTSIAPTSGNLTLTLNVVFTGTNFISGVSSVNFGSDITVNTTSVDSATQITANITIASTAATGPRNVSVTNSAPGGGTSATQSFTVINPATTTQVVSSLNPSTFGLSVTFTATVSSAAGTPTGTLIFYDGACGVSALTGSLNLASGQATFTTTSLNGGTHNIFACYTPSGIFQSSFGSVSQVVTQATPTVTFTGAPAAAYFSSQFMVSATTNASTTPTITASGGCTILGTTVTMISGTVTCSLQASWAADTNYVLATAMQSTIARPAPVTVTVPDTTVPYDGDQHAVTPTFSAVVSSYTLTYTGIAPTVYTTSSTAPTEPGSYSAVATVTDTNYTGNGSGTLTISQLSPALNLTLKGAPTSGPYGTLLRFELGMASGSPCPTGTITFLDGTNAVGTITPLPSPCTGNVEFQIATLPVGDRSITAQYSGDRYYLQATSTAVPYTVNKDGTSVSLGLSAATINVGDSVTLTATVGLVTGIDGTSIPPAGTIAFNQVNSDGSFVATLGSGITLSGTTASLTVSTLPAGDDYAQAVFYDTDGNFLGSSSSLKVETVNLRVPQLKLSPSSAYSVNAAGQISIPYGTLLSRDMFNATATDPEDSTQTVPGSFSYVPDLGTLQGVGNVQVTVTFQPADPTTYSSSSITETISVIPATLTVTSNSKSMTYGDTLPTLDATITGFVNSETLEKSGVTGSPSCSIADTTPIVAHSPYTITCTQGTLAATNYGFSFANSGTLTVKPAPLTFTAGSYSGVYDGSSHALSACNVSANIDGLTCTNNPAGPVGPDVGSGTVTPVVSGSTSNYSVTSNNGAWSITALGVNLTAGSYGPAAYDGSTHAPSACASSAPTFVTCTNSPSPVGPDFGSGAVSPTPVYGKGNSNDYSFTSNAGSWSITALTVTVTGGSYSGVYDSYTHALSACASTYAGVSCTNNPAGPVGPDVGGAAVAPISSLVSGIAADYSITPVKGAWSITALTVTVTGGGYSGVYDGYTHAPSACTSSAPTFVTCTNNPSPVGPDFGSGAVSPTPVYGKGIAADYTITPSPGAWSITALTVTVTGGSYSGVYDSYTHALSACASTYAGVTCTNSPLGPVGPDVGGAAVAPVASLVSGIAADYTISPLSGNVMITPAATTIAVTSSSPSNTSTFMQLVTFTATVCPQYAGIPTGSVTFYNNGVSLVGAQAPTLNPALGTCSNGATPTVATFSTSSLPANTDNITATYSGDSAGYGDERGDFTGNTSSPIQQVVSPAPVVSLSPLSLSFPNTDVGVTSPATYVTLTNIGDAALSLDPTLVYGYGISITGPNASDFTVTNSTTCGTSLGYATGANSCKIYLTFKPSDTGVETATLQISDNDNNDPNGAQQFVSLTGSGLSEITGTSLYTDAIFATSSSCGALTLSGGSTVDSFVSTGAPALDAKTGGDVGTNGNVTLNGSNSAIYGNVYAPSGVNGACSKASVTGLTTTGKAQVGGNLVALNAPITFPNPPAPYPAPPTTSQNISGSCPSSISTSLCANTGSKAVTLKPGTYGNVNASGGTTVHVGPGTYNMNSLTLSGKSILHVDSGPMMGPVIINLTGASLNGGNPALDASGGSFENPTYIPANLQFAYGGSHGVNLSGGSAAYAVVYAPNAIVNMSGGTDFFGSIIGSTVTDSGGTATHYDTNLPNIAGGNYIWFPAVVNNVNLGGATGQVKLFVTDGSISFTANGAPYTVTVPNAVVTFNSSSAISPTTIYDPVNTRWSTSIPASKLTGNTFATGVAFLVPSNFPGGIQNVQFTAAFTTDTPGITFQWQWAAGVYTTFDPSYATVNVNPEDGSANKNGSDPAGTPEGFKQSATFGATGGYFSAASGVVPTVAQVSASPSSLDFGTQAAGTPSTSQSAMLNNNYSGPFTINSIQVMGSDPGDFAVTNNCPVGVNNGFSSGANCTFTVSFTPSFGGGTPESAKIVINNTANNSPQTVYLSGTGQ